MPSSNKRPGEDALSPLPTKSSRNDLRLEYEASGGGKRKGAANSSRTGQACDRCKVGGYCLIDRLDGGMGWAGSCVTTVVLT